MNEEKIRGLLGLSVRARQAVFGADGCLKTLQKGEGGLLLMDESLSFRMKEKYQAACRRANVPAAMLPEGLLEEAAGRPGKAVLLRKGSLAQQMDALLAQKG